MFNRLFSVADMLLNDNQELLRTFKNCFVNTLETTTMIRESSDPFVFTGDIHAMWLRDSSAQVMHYLPFLSDEPKLKDIVKGLSRRQMKCILTDSYANAYNENSNGLRDSQDRTVQHPMVWERKYELDSLCYPILLAFSYYRESGDVGIFDETFELGCERIVQTMITEQRHAEQSPYRFEREVDDEATRITETLTNNGMGTPVNYTGMTWSGFRPSDDACCFGYLIPSNMLAVVVLGHIEEIFTNLLKNPRLLGEVKGLKNEIDLGISRYGTVLHPKYGRIYAYETDGYGNYNLMDDANAPSLLSIPYFGYVNYNDEVYQNTRRFVLSNDNPYYFSGSAACGIGSPHTPNGYIWPISLMMEALTEESTARKKEIIDILVQTNARTCFMHESFHKDNPDKFTRHWFAWANSLFAELVFAVYLQKEYCGGGF